MHLILCAGQYCIYKERRQCPRGLEQGNVFWDDEDERNANKKSGTLPDGEYGSETKIYFCCKTSGNKNDPIHLPAEYPFFLLAYASKKCQMVKWAISSVEWIYYDTEENKNADHRGGAYPYNAGIMHPTIYYCYYRGEQSQLNI